jgi:hypothetical protein
MLMLLLTMETWRKPLLKKNGSLKRPKKKDDEKNGLKKNELVKNGFTAKKGWKKKSEKKNGRWKKIGANNKPRSANGKSQKPLEYVYPSGVQL